MKLQQLISGAAISLAASIAHAGNPPLETLTHAKQVVLAYGYACVLKDDGTVWCWGDNGAGVLGDGTQQRRNYAAPVAGVSDATALAAGGLHTCALRNDGTVQCWGSNSYGELGRIDIGDVSTSPVFVHGAVYTGANHLSDVASIATGDQHTCAQLSSGYMVCWGKNNYGQLGDGTTNMSGYPVYVEGVYAVTGISVGNEHSCAILKTGNMQCWGHNELGQLGDGGSDPHPIPGSVVISTSPKQNLYPVTDIAIGYIHACAKMDDGLGNTGIQCWGDNRWGQLGDGEFEDKSDLPTAVLANGNVSTPLSGVVTVAAGGFTTCAVLTTGLVQCWGDDSYGQLGTGLHGDLSFPVFSVQQAVDEIFKDGFN
jgi:alpha-tubulin suppressor-like RCC1 family protein